MVDTIVEPQRCDGCGAWLTSPRDGRWRWAKSGKVFESLALAEEAALSLNRREADGEFEFRAGLDEQGRARIASRRKSA